jgi:hypothetical protein
MEQTITIDQCDGMWQVKCEDVVIYETRNGAAAEMYATHLRSSTRPITVGDVKQVKTDTDVLDS